MCCWPMKIRHSQAHLLHRLTDRKSTRLNSSHSQISYAVFCLKKKKLPYHTVLISSESSTILRPASLYVASLGSRHDIVSMTSALVIPGKSSVRVCLSRKIMS